MKRIPEPELMDSPDQTQAYAAADFSESNALFTDLFINRFPELDESGTLLDLGCGPADICIRIARRLPGWSIMGLDAGINMLKHAKQAVAEASLESQVKLHLAHLPETGLTAASFDALTSNSLLHHLPDPSILWQAINKLGSAGAAITVMDLCRPESREAAQGMIDLYAADEAEVLREDFYNSLLAAYTVDEISAQLEAAGLSHLEVSRPSDRHWLVQGFLAS